MGTFGAFTSPTVQLDTVGASVENADPSQFEQPPPPPDETSPEMPVYGNPRRPGVGCSSNLIPLRCDEVLEDINSRAGGIRSYRVDALLLFSGEVTRRSHYPAGSGQDEVVYVGTYSDDVERWVVDMRVSLAGFVGGGVQARRLSQPQNTGRAPLSGKRLENYNKQSDKARTGLQSSKCRDFLLTHGINPNDLLNAVNVQRAYDGLTSTISRGEAGFYRNEGVFESPYLVDARNLTVESYFNKAPRGYNRGAVTGTYPGGVGMINNTTVADRSDVYWGKNGINSANIVHEALHSYTGAFYFACLSLPIKLFSSCKCRTHGVWFALFE